jgi:hypothetical protein
MALILDGDGTISGLNVGGLPDGSVNADDLASNAVTTAKITDANITAAKLDGAQSGSAPIYAARAWVNFDGTTSSPSTIRGSGNVSSITKHNTGRYTINFTTAMPDANYCLSGANSSPESSSNSAALSFSEDTAPTTTSCRVRSSRSTSYLDTLYISAAFFV